MADTLPLSQMDIEASRTRARRRLIGMVVLVGAGVVGFPWLFETQPRPLSGDVQIVQAGAPGKADGSSASGAAGAGDGARAGAVGSSRAVSGKVAVAAIVAPPEPVAERTEGKEPREEIVNDAPPVAAPKPVAKPLHDKAVAEKKAVEKAADKAAEKKTADKKLAEAKSADKASADKASARYIVQIGAFTEATLAHEARMKVERLGIKTYTQAVDTPGGKKIRVRIGPYADKAEADKAMASLRKAGLGGSLLTL